MIEWILSSSLLILIVMGLRFALKGRISLCLQYALWMLVLLRLVIPVSFGASGLSAMNAFENAAWYSGIGAFLDREELPYGTMKDTTLTAEAAEAEHGGTVYKIHGYSVESGRSELHTYFFKASARTVVGSVLTTVWIAVASASAIVSGIRSPHSDSTRRMTNCPALRARATSG